MERSTSRTPHRSSVWGVTVGCDGPRLQLALRQRVEQMDGVLPGLRVVFCGGMKRCKELLLRGSPIYVRAREAPLGQVVRMPPE